eukprot:1161356-Pelagomonas_calceolata.AAC.2
MTMMMVMMMMVVVVAITTTIDNSERLQLPLPYRFAIIPHPYKKLSLALLPHRPDFFPAYFRRGNHHLFALKLMICEVPLHYYEHHNLYYNYPNNVKGSTIESHAPAPLFVRQHPAAQCCSQKWTEQDQPEKLQSHDCGRVASKGHGLTKMAFLPTRPVSEVLARRNTHPELQHASSPHLCLIYASVRCFNTLPQCAASGHCLSTLLKYTASMRCSSTLPQCAAVGHCLSALLQLSASMRCLSTLPQCAASVHCLSALLEHTASVRCFRTLPQCTASVICLSALLKYTASVRCSSTLPQCAAQVRVPKCLGKVVLDTGRFELKRL